MSLRFINPESFPPPVGYSNGVLAAPNGSLLFISGQIGWDEQGRIVSMDFVEQFDRALQNVIAVIEAAGGQAQQLARLVIYVTDKKEYRSRTKEIGARWRARLGAHYPAMALVEVVSLLEDSALVELEGIAVFYEV